MVKNWVVVVVFLVLAMFIQAFSRKSVKKIETKEIVGAVLGTDTSLINKRYPVYIKQQDTFYFFAPLFLRKTPKGCFESFTIKDTTFHFEFYDFRDSIIDNVEDIADVGYISMFKSYIDSQHTYKDHEGKLQLLPIEQIQTRYDRIDTDKWMYINYANHKYTKIVEQPYDITTIDTVINTYTNLDTQFYEVGIFEYYKVTEKRF